MPTEPQPDFRPVFLAGLVQRLHPHRRRLFYGGIVLTVVAIGCATTGRLIVAPPQIPGATYVGSETCAACHEKISAGFATADHARLQAPGENAANAGCESCHGPGSKHVDSSGARGTILNPRKNPETCFACHLDKRGQFRLPHAHPVLAGKVSCTDCHNPHQGAGFTGSQAMLTRNETCTRCHTAQRGPFAFEHEVMRDGCTTCHNPHGTVNAKMLTSRNANLCLKCHAQAANNSVVVGGMPHSAFLRSGTCWTAGCHEAVHGSQTSTTLRY
jgi:predicted CXXCH cytochrome family protein